MYVFLALSSHHDARHNHIMKVRFISHGTEYGLPRVKGKGKGNSGVVVVSPTTTRRISLHGDRKQTDLLHLRAHRSAQWTPQCL